MLYWSKASLTFVLAMLWLAGGARSSPRQSVTIAGGQTLPLQRQGTGFKQAENERITITDAGLQAVNLNGNPYVRWNFGIGSKQATALSLVRIEDVTNTAPLLLVNDLAPQLDAG